MNNNNNNDNNNKNNNDNSNNNNKSNNDNNNNRNNQNKLNIYITKKKDCPVCRFNDSASARTCAPMQADMRPHTCCTSPYKLVTHISTQCKQFLTIKHNKYYLCDDIYAPINYNLGQLQCPIGALLRILAAHDYVILG